MRIFYSFSFDNSECNCNELADECVFDQQLWVDSNFKSGGRCINCKNNTDGRNCERCKRYHYRSNKAEACKPCGCNQIGSRSLSCNDKGECLCHSGVAGVKCDKCKDGYFGYSSTGCRYKGVSVFRKMNVSVFRKIRKKRPFWNAFFYLWNNVRPYFIRNYEIFI